MLGLRDALAVIVVESEMVEWELGGDGCMDGMDTSEMTGGGHAPA